MKYSQYVKENTNTHEDKENVLDNVVFQRFKD